jgi:hypothetical protein
MSDSILCSDKKKVRTSPVPFSFWLIQKVQENTGGSLWKTNLFSIIAIMRHSKIKLALFNITIPGLPSRLTLIGTL